jgi:hypothetical protein
MEVASELAERPRLRWALIEAMLVLMVEAIAELLQKGTKALLP